MSGTGVVIKRLFFILGLLFLSSAHAAKDCSKPVLDEYLVRESSKVLRGFSKSFLVQRFEDQHIARYQQGLIAWKTFYPFWIFSSRSLLEELLAAFPLSEDHQVERVSNEYHSIEDFLDRWEKDFTAKGGQISSVWTRKRKMTGRRRFLRRFYLELAEFHTKGLGVSDQQATELTLDADSPLSYLAGAAKIINLFDSSDAFLNEARTFIRLRRGQRVIPRTYPGQGAIVAARTQLRVLQPSAGGLRSRPLVDEDLKLHRQREWVRSTVGALDSHHEEIAPLAFIFLDSTNTGCWPNFELDYPAYDDIVDLFGSFAWFMSEVNRELPFPIYPKAGQRWEHELLVQAGMQTVLDSGQLVEELTLNTSSFLFQRAKSSESAIKVEIGRRLRDLFGP